jgi:uncharacterized protein YhjY with autotransporter beta-barrel domain
LSVVTGQSVSVTIDATTGARGGPFTAVTIVTPPSPATGSAVVSGLSIVFSPTLLFTGTTTFTYSLTDAMGTSAPAVISVTVQGRPDPSKDPSVNAIVTAMTDSTERFISTQIANFTQRLDTLHGAAGGDQGGNALNVAGLSITVNGRPLAALRSAAEHDLLIRTYGRSYDLAPGTKPSGRLGQSGATVQRTGIWVDGTFDTGSHAGTIARSALSSGATGVSAGIDYRVGDRLAIGIGGGFGRDANDLIVGRDQGTRGRTSDVAAYGSLRTGRSGFIDALAGYGTLHFDTRRVDPMSGGTALGARDGHALFGSVTTGHRFGLGGGSVSPYAGVNAVSADLGAFTETGVGVGALTYGVQQVRDVSAVAGVRAQASFPTAIGMVSPRAAIEYGRRLSATSSASLWYADHPTVPFGIDARQIGASPLNVAVGATLRLDGGFLFSADYRSIIDRESVSHLLRIGISTRL